MDTKPKDNQLSCDQKTLSEKEELINRLFCLINLAFSQVGKRGEDYLVLQQIHKIKSRIIKDNPNWSLSNSNDYLIEKIMKYINAINTVKEWNHEDNIKVFTEVRQSMLALKEYDPQWYLDKDDIEKHNPSLCYMCRKLNER